MPHFKHNMTLSDRRGSRIFRTLVKTKNIRGAWLPPGGGGVASSGGGAWLPPGGHGFLQGCSSEITWDVALT